MTKRTKKMAWSNEEAREALERYEMIVRMTARRLKPVAALGQALDEDDLCSEGRVAVLEALSTYQGFGIEEHTWVRTRVRQRMIDAIRRLDLRSRDEMRLAVRHAAGQTETADEMERGRAIAARRLVSFDSAPVDSEPLAARLRDSRAPMADEVAGEHARREQLLGALKVLPPRQRTAIELGLFEGLALREIGDRMGISESRVCQLQKRAVQHLQKAIGSSVERDAA
ncbi:MAG: sigma-70 family RNA polymerase sigma factor [Proteobacteria bacterium]|nr:sigma-70 family RNA polymerase sigma factor [Pseudomonadota bacterium]